MDWSRYACRRVPVSDRLKRFRKERISVADHVPAVSTNTRTSRELNANDAVWRVRDPLRQGVLGKGLGRRRRNSESSGRKDERKAHGTAP